MNAAMIQNVCEKGHLRIGRPWRLGECVYATNGKIGIRLAASDFPAEELPGAYKVEQFPWDHDQVKEWVRLKPERVLTECEACCGDGKGGWCEKCRGDGKVEITCDDCDDTHMHDCPDCHGTRRTSCTTTSCAECRGTGKAVSKKAHTKIGSHYFANWLLMLAAECGDGTVEIEADPGEKARIRFDGGCGYVMNMLVAE